MCHGTSGNMDCTLLLFIIVIILLFTENET